jgi:hypothetical protein
MASKLTAEEAEHFRRAMVKVYGGAAQRDPWRWTLICSSI